MGSKDACPLFWRKTLSFKTKQARSLLQIETLSLSFKAVH